MIEIYRRAWRYALLCPLLFLLPAVVELIQHVAELHAGFYDSIAAMKAAEGSPGRMVAGHVKVFALFQTGYWVVRFHAFGAQLARYPRLVPTCLEGQDGM